MRPMEVQVFISVVSTAITPMVLRVLRLRPDNRCSGLQRHGGNVQKNSVVDLEQTAPLKPMAIMLTASGAWVSANALTVDVTGAAANGVEVRGGTTTIGAIAIFLAQQWPRHQWFRRDNHFYWHGSATKQHLFRRFLWCLGPDGNGCCQHAKYRYYS